MFTLYWTIYLMEENDFGISLSPVIDGIWYGDTVGVDLNCLHAFSYIDISYITEKSKLQYELNTKRETYHDIVSSWNTILSLT